MSKTVGVIQTPEHRITLTGDLAQYYEEFRAAAADLEGKHKAYQDAQQRYQRALAIFSKLACGGNPSPI